MSFRNLTIGNKGRNMQSVEARPRNILDSSAPEPRGKERMIPKPKKPKTLKRKINYEKDIVKETTEEPKPNEDSCGSRESDLGNSNNKSVNEDEPDDHESGKIRGIDQDLLSEKFSILNIKNDLETLIQIILHPPYHREYVQQALTNVIEFTTYIILINLIRFQDRVHHKNPEKLQMKRRYVCGFNQVNKSVRLNKAKAVIIAPDIQKIIENGILDQTINRLVSSCSEKEIPVIFTSTRNRLAKVCCKNPRSYLSCIAVFDYSGTHDEFHRLIELVDASKEIYRTNRTNLTSYLKNLSETSLMEIYKLIKERNQIPENLQIYREAIYTPLQRNIFCYIKLIKQQKNKSMMQEIPR